MSAHTFYLAKGVVALVATVLVVIHMNLSWHNFDRDEDGVRIGISQRLRYLSWFLFIVLVAGASKEQLDDGVSIAPRNVGAMFVIAFATVAAVVSIDESRQNRRRRH